MKPKGVKNLVKTIIIWVLLINFLSCLIVRLIQGGRFTYDRNDFPNYNGKMILISGMLSQPDSAYRYIDMPYGGALNLRFSMLGYNPMVAGRQLRELTESDDKVIGMSVGCKAVIYSGHPEVERIFVNPMTHSICLKPELQSTLEFSAPIAEIASYLLGWIAVLPVIRSGTGDHYSLALLVDQLFWCYYGDPEYKDLGSLDKTGVIISTNDEFLEGEIIRSIYEKASIETIETEHGRIGDENVSGLYQTAIKNLLAY